LVEVPNQLVEVVIADGKKDLSGLEALLLPVGGYDILTYLDASEDLILCWMRRRVVRRRSCRRAGIVTGTK
jgi:hypothetical protein